MQKLLMEFLGTFFFVLTIAMTGNAGAIAAMLMAWIYIGAHVSGANYNPAVSFALSLRRLLSWNLSARYMIAQVAGAFVAFALTHYLHGKVVVPAPGAGISFLQAFLVEILLTLVFVLIVLVVATSQRYKNETIAGFVIGFTIPALAGLGGPISGGLFNPAISIGSTVYAALTGTPVAFENLFVHVGGAFIGAFIAYQLFRYFNLDR